MTIMEVIAAYVPDEVLSRTSVQIEYDDEIVPLAQFMRENDTDIEIERVRGPESLSIVGPDEGDEQEATLVTVETDEETIFFYW